MVRFSETAANTPESYISDLLKLRPFDVVETNQIIHEFSEIAKKRLQSPIEKGSGPLMLRSHISPPETPFTELVGKKAIGIDIGGTNLRMSVGEVDKSGHIIPIGKIKSKEISIKYDSLDDFFEMLLKNGLEKLLRENPDFPLACIFSFPGSGIATEDDIDMILEKELTKEWVIKGSAGKKLGKELNEFLLRKDEEIKKQKLPNLLKKKPFGKRKYLIENDTVALIKDNQTDAGIVCTSGYNWSIVTENSLFDENQQNGKTIINSEAGSANTAPEIPVITQLLLERIAQEENKPKETIPLRDEYQISGKYLGRTLGLVVDKLRDNYNLFTSVKNTVFPKSFVVSNILAAEKTGDWKKVKKNFQTHHDFSEQEKKLLIQIASALRDRSAQIVVDHLIGLWLTVCPDKNKLNISSDGPIIQHMPGWKDKFIQEIDFVTQKRLKIEIRETSYQGKMRDFRGIFDVMSQAIEYFNRKN